MAYNDVLLDRAIRHQVYLERFKTSELPRLIRVLNELDRDLLGEVAASDPDSLTGKRLAMILGKVRDISREASQRYADELTGTVNALAAYEGAWGAAELGRVIAPEVLVVAGLEIFTPDPALLRAAVFSRPLQGKLLKDWIADLDRARVDRLQAAIRRAAIEGMTVGQLVQLIRGTRANQFHDGVLDISRRGAEALARTALQHVSNAARHETYAANRRVIAEIQWVSTLDGRTTPYCRAMDGKRLPIDKGPRPPAHINCRSTTVPVLVSWESLGIKAREISEGTRASMNGQVADTLDYDTWLRRQPVEFQDDVMGKTKGILFREGLKMEKFVHLKTQRSFTLQELREREPDTWRAAFS